MLETWRGRVKGLLENRVLTALVLCFLGWLVYSNTFQASFHWDDEGSILKNAWVRHLSDAPRLFSFCPTRFLPYFSFALDYHFHGFSLFGYHVINLFLHLATTLTVWWLTRLLLLTKGLRSGRMASNASVMAFFAALLFALHPLQTETVTYIAQRITGLASFFYLLTLALYLKARLTESLSPRQSRAWRGMAFLTAVLAIFSKEITVTLPLAILLVESVFFEDSVAAKIKKCAIFFVVLAVPLVMLLTRGWDLTKLARPSPDVTPISTGTYLLTQVHVVAAYFRLLLLPVGQNLDYDIPLATSWANGVFLFHFAILAGLLTAALVDRRHPLVRFGILWIFLTLLPESSLVPIKDVMFEHRLYLPMWGWTLVVVGLVGTIRTEIPGKAGMLLLIFFIGTCGVLTYQRNAVWKNEISLWSDVIAKSPHKARAWHNRGFAFMGQGKLDAALADVDKALALNPKLFKAWNSRGVICQALGRPAEALENFNHAIAINPEDPDAYGNRAVVFAIQGLLDKALVDLDKAIALNPQHLDAYANRARVYEGLGRSRESQEDLRKVKALRGHSD